MLSLLRKLSTKLSSDWWSVGLSSDERSTIEKTFKPMGAISASSIANSANPKELATLASWFKKEPVRHIGYKLLERGKNLLTPEIATLDRHFYWSQRGEFYYRWRELDEFALSEAEESFKQQITMAEEAAAAFLTELDTLPSHKGYDQLRIISEKRSDWIEAKRFCLQAKEMGWAGSWDKHLQRLEKKKGK